MSEAQPFQVHVDEQGVCVVRGELDEFTTRALESFLDEYPDVCLIDLGEVSFLDSAGLRGLLHVHQRLAANGLTLTVRRSSRPVRRLMRLAGVSHLFVPTEQDPHAAGC